MNRRTKREMGEYGKILASMAVGAFFLLAAMVAWMVDGGCFVKKADAGENGVCVGGQGR